MESISRSYVLVNDVNYDYREYSEDCVVEGSILIIVEGVFWEVCKDIGV